MSQSTSGFREHVGFDVHEDGEGRANVTLQAGDEHLNPGGAVHGGVLATLIDSAMGAAVRTTGEGAERPATIALTVTYLEPGQPGGISVTAQVRKRGRRITIVEAEAVQHGDMIAHGIGTFTTG